MAKVIQVPRHTFETIDTKEQRNSFCHLMEVIVNSTPQRNDTETFLAHDLRKKIEELKKRLELFVIENGSSVRLTLEDAEVLFVRNGLEYLRRADRVQGELWYYVVKPLCEAKDVEETNKEVQSQNVL
jgi:hypothetical protein